MCDMLGSAGSYWGQVVLRYVHLRRICARFQFVEVVRTWLIGVLTTLRRGLYPYDFTTGNFYLVLARCSNQKRNCLVSETCYWLCLLQWDVGSRMASATKRVKRKTEHAVSQEQQRWQRAANSWKKGIDERPADSLPINQERSSAGARQETLVTEVEDNVASIFKIDAVAQVADIRLAQEDGDVGTQCPTGVWGFFQQEEGREDKEDGLRSGCQNHAMVADGVCVAVEDEVGNDILVDVEEKVKNWIRKYCACIVIKSLKRLLMHISRRAFFVSSMAETRQLNRLKGLYGYGL